MVMALLSLPFSWTRIIVYQNADTINQFTGDGVMALFDAPLALEDHARQARRAALSIQKLGVLGSGHANVLIVQP